MDRESVERLRFDRRLQRRRHWLAENELEGHFEGLPDVSGKMTTIAEAEEEAKRAGEARSSEAPASSGFGSPAPSAPPSPSSPESPESPDAPDPAKVSRPELASSPAPSAGLGGGSFGSDPVGGGYGSDGSGSSS